MRYSEKTQYVNLRIHLWDLCEKNLEKPAMLASDYILARVYKHCCIIMDLEDLLGNKEIENEFYHFKDMFETKARKETVKKEFLSLVRQIHTLKDKILATP